MAEPYNEAYINELADKWQRGTLTEEERAYFNRWYDRWRSGEIELPEGYASNPLEIRDRNHRMILERIRNENKRPPLGLELWQWVALAAAIALAIGAVTLYPILQIQQRPVIDPQASQRTIRPGSNKATLTLADGKAITLDDAKAGVIAGQGATQISKTGSGIVAYQSTKEAGNAPILYNTINTPNGGTYQVALPDGSHAWLNAASSLRFPTAFTGSQREVQITGEVYFEVARDKAHPFVVATPGQTITVLGTHFNVNAYADEKKFTTTLLEGSVKVTVGQQVKILKPGQQAGVSNAAIQISDADTQLAVAWKDGRIAFSHTPVQQVLREISRWYDIRIQYEGAAPDYTISGETPRNADLDAILKLLKSSDVHYKLAGRTLIITP
ncbi:FecR family protein [Taibaiella koreensis]|uniref:FecR family protein n=1 Tax=Taibaiella koreensis TaxID=1268548 RepID=UPI000E59D5E0|nr:FecR domain-containing protein [Taibaiella koreensis]